MRRILCLFAAFALLGGCSTGGRPAVAASGDLLSVVATTPEVADFARVVGAGHVRVTQIIKPGVDPHDYEPTPADLQAIATAAMVVKNGVGLERWLDPTIASAGFHGPVVDTSRGVALRAGEPGDAEMAQGDPHIWHDPLNAKIMAGNIAAALGKADPADVAVYRRQFSAYSEKLDELDRSNQAAFAGLAPERRKLVTNHDAFGYYVDRYGLEFVGSVIPSMDTSAELSAKQLSDLVAKIRATGVRAVFTESSLPPKTAESIARQAGVRVVSSLYGDSLGPLGTPEGTYLGAEQHNTDTIVAALRG